MGYITTMKRLVRDITEGQEEGKRGMRTRKIRRMDDLKQGRELKREAENRPECENVFVQNTELSLHRVFSNKLSWSIVTRN